MQGTLVGQTSFARSSLTSRVEDVVGADFGVQKFVENFDVLVNVAGSVKHLKELVLQLAVRGGLSPRGAESADPLLLELQRARAKLGKCGVRVGDRSLPVSDEEAPHALPPGWRWVRLRDLGGFLGGGTPAKSNAAFWEGPLPWVSPKDMKRPYINDAEDHISVAAVEASAVKLIPPHSLLYVVRGMILAHSFPVAIATRELTINQDMKAVVLAMPELSEFVLRSLQAARRRVLAKVERSSHGTCRLESEAVEMLPLALPPLAEQKRIVAKVDQLMALCDDLEARETKKREVGTRLTKSSLEALTTAEGRDEFDAAWKMVVENFDVLIDRAEKVDELRGAIRNLALRGALTRQEKVEESAVHLLERIEAEQARRVRLKQARRMDPTPRVVGEDMPFPVPESWAWMRLGNLCWKVADGPHFSPKYVPKEQGVPFLSGRNIKVDGFELETVKYVSREDHLTFCERTKPEPGDVLYTKGGTTGVALVNDLAFEFSVWVHVAVLKLDLANVFPGYVAMALNSPHCYAQSQKLTHGTGNRDLGLTRMVLITLPLPPFEEQKRVVAKVEQLMKVCNDLEAKLLHAGDRAAKFAEAAVDDIVATESAS